MTNDQLMRTIAALGAAALGLLAALWLRAPAEAAVVALIGGLAAVALSPWPARTTPVAEDAPSEPPAAPPSGVDDLMAAFEEPLLIVRERRVMHANPAARTLLGAHIDGVDVRLAIRHPAAAERLAHETTGDETDTVEIAGLGEAERPWLMQVRGLPDGAKLVRLTDLGAMRAAERVRVDFVANASHELRTPLATLLGFLETLEDEEAASDAETRTRFIGIMRAEATRMRNLVDDLMSLSRIEAERFQAPREPIALPPLVDEARVALGQLLKTRKAKLIVEDEADGMQVAGDRAQLGQMLTNLIANALKYGREGAPVRVRLAQDGAMLALAVIDEGDGIEAEHIPRLTERFYRVDPGRSRQVGGTGLGLAIVKHIVQRHRGRLEIDSQIGAGTEVRVLLPLAIAKEEASGRPG